ncbi:putative ATP-binding cassette [Operophtera brumata]|uniref:Putative ATP-binding cassette n=1 Tax=Operophtera brumata TaxID=104452 RepID=A0A0L7LSP1_OPEBR|nr:putative ATP-binding cassette [Operophtera brumata]
MACLRSLRTLYKHRYVMTVQATDNARWVLHKVFMLSPQFALGDCLLEIAKNTIQAQVCNDRAGDRQRALGTAQGVHAVAAVRARRRLA